MTTSCNSQSRIDMAQNNVREGESGSSVSEMRVTFRALDGFELGGTYISPIEIRSPPISMLVCPGGGVPSARYINFARFMAQHGVAVLLFDYRGIGLSKPRSLRGFVACVEDWSEYDCAGAIEYLASLNLAADLVAVAHSIGAMLIFGAPNSSRIARFLVVAGHAAYYGDYNPRYRIPMAILWHGVMPVMSRAFGYFPGRLMRLGEDIPKGVALQWAAQRRPLSVASRRHVDSSRLATWLARCKAVKGDALAIGFADDGFATPKGLARLQGIIPGVMMKHLHFSPHDLGLTRVGHFGFFGRTAGNRLWPRAVDFARGEIGIAPGTS